MTTLHVTVLSDEEWYQLKLKDHSKIYNFCPTCKGEIVNLKCTSCDRDWSEEIFDRHKKNADLCEDDKFFTRLCRDNPNAYRRLKT